MRSRIFCQFIAALFAFCPYTTGGAPQDHQYVHASITLSRDSIQAGGQTELRVMLDPEEGIHISADPPPTIVLDSSVVVRLAGRPTLSTASSGYVNTEAPIKFGIVVDTDAHEGVQRLKGMCLYYYCSDREQWCKRGHQHFGLTLHVDTPNR
jgi:hypothetical protein